MRYAVIWYDEGVDGLQTFKGVTDNIYEAIGHIEDEIRKGKKYHLEEHNGKLISERRFEPLECEGGYMWSLNLKDSCGCVYKWRWLILFEQGWDE